MERTNIMNTMPHLVQLKDLVFNVDRVLAIIPVKRPAGCDIILDGNIRTFTQTSYAELVDTLSKIDAWEAKKETLRVR